MRYELLLQPGQPGATYDPSRVDALLAERGVAREGNRVWRLGALEVEVRGLVEGGRLIATEVRLPLSARPDDIRKVVGDACALASEAQVVLFDPQLGKSLTAADDALVADQYLRTARWAGEYLGVGEAIGVMPSAEPEPGALKPGTKVLLGIIAFFVVLYFVASAIG